MPQVVEPGIHDRWKATLSLPAGTSHGLADRLIEIAPGQGHTSCTAGIRFLRNHQQI
jgi:hypothetical protein